MVVALLALFVALGGSGYAAVQLNVRSHQDGAPLPGKKLKRNSVTGRQRGASDLGERRPSARSAGSANPARRQAARRVPRGLRRDGLVNAGKLGGLAPTSFVRRECDQSNGQVKGVATVAASAAFPAAFTEVPAATTAAASRWRPGGSSMGRYEVRFNGSPVTEAVATARVTGFKADMISVTNSSPGLFIVYVLDPLPAPASLRRRRLHVDDPVGDSRAAGNPHGPRRP